MLYNFILILHVITCLGLIGVVLIQRGRGAGLVEALAGAESLFGTKTSDYLVKATTILAVLFFVFSITLTILSKQRGRSITDQLSVSVDQQKNEVDGLDKEKAVEAKIADVQEEQRVAE